MPHSFGGSAPSVDAGPHQGTPPAPCYGRRSMSAIADVVVVSYNSSKTLRQCVEPLCRADGMRVIVVDNASRDGSVETVRDLPVSIVALDENHGFAYGCNRGWREGTAPAVLFLNPDARIEPASVERLAAALAERPRAGLVAPRVKDEDGRLDYSVRRFPSLRSTYSQALFLHRLFPRARWSDETVRTPDAYDEAHRVDWVSGACVLVRRSALEAVGGWDEGFFLYGEDVDLCRRLQTAGWEVWYEPSAEAVHAGGGSAPRASLLPTLAASRVRYARLHCTAPVAALQRIGIALGELTHGLLSAKGAEARAGHRRALALIWRDGEGRPRPGG